MRKRPLGVIEGRHQPLDLFGRETVDAQREHPRRQAERLPGSAAQPSSLNRLGLTRLGNCCSARKRPISLLMGSSASLTSSATPNARRIRSRFSVLTPPSPASSRRATPRETPARSASCAWVSPRKRRHRDTLSEMSRSARRIGKGAWVFFLLLGSIYRS